MYSVASHSRMLMLRRIDCWASFGYLAGSATVTQQSCPAANVSASESRAPSLPSPS